jgi:hypothetical protein
MIGIGARQIESLMSNLADLTFSLKKSILHSPLPFGFCDGLSNLRGEND